MAATGFAGADRSDPSRSLAEAAPLEAALRAGRNHRRHGARAQTGWRISLRQRYQRLLRMDACASRTLARFFLDRGARLRLAPAMGRLHDDALWTQSRARRPSCGGFVIPEGGVTSCWHSGARVARTRDSGFDASHRPGMTNSITPIGGSARNSPPALRSKASGARNSPVRSRYPREPAPGGGPTEAKSKRARWPIPDRSSCQRSASDRGGRPQSREREVGFFAPTSRQGGRALPPVCVVLSKPTS